MAVNTISTDNHLGCIVTGKVETGSVRLGDRMKVLPAEADNLTGVSAEVLIKGEKKGKVTKLFYLEGLTRRDVTEASAGEIV